MTKVSLPNFRSQLYEPHASQHVRSCADEAAPLAYRRRVRPLVPLPVVGPIIAVGYSRGMLVRFLQADGFDTESIDISPERAALARAAGVIRVRQGDFRAVLVAHPTNYAAITATNLLENLAEPEVLQTSFTTCSIVQLAAVAGFGSVRAHSSPPVAHRATSAVRVMVRQVVSGCYRVAPAAETGMLRAHIVTQNLTFAACKGVATVKRAES